MSSSYGNNPFYQSLLGTSQIDNVNTGQVNTQSLTVTSLTSGLVSSTSGGNLQNALVGTGLDYDPRNNTLSNQGVTSLISGATGPLILSNSTGDLEISLPQNITTSSSPQFARLLNSSIGTFSVIQGTNAGNAFSGDRCVLIGDSVMAATSSSQQSTAIGNSALGFATGNFNTAVGSSAGFAVTTGTINTIVGTNAGRGTTPLTTGSGNVLLGAGANTSSGSSSNEIVLGFGVGAGSNTAKIYASNGLNVSNLTNGVLKATSGTITSNATTDDLTEGKTNLYFTNARAQGAFTAGTGIDISSGVISNTSVTGATGPQGIQGLTGYTGPIGITGPSNLTISNFNVFGGVNAGISVTAATGCVGIGYNALSSLTDSLNNVAVGTDALKVLTTTAVQGSNTAVGFASLSQCSTGVRNTCIGSGSGRAVVGGRANTALGMSSALNLTSGDNNVIIGLNSGGNILTANDNITIGAFSMSKGTSFMTGPDGRNVALGYYAGHSLSGYPTNNVAIGYQALWNAGQVSDNIAIGTNSLASVVNGGGGNIAIGGSSTSIGGTLTNGQGGNIGLGLASNLYISGDARNNIGIGGYSNFNTSSGNNNISIGQATQASSATSGNEITISTNGTISVPISGRGNNTALIDARNGLYSYSPAYWWGYADNHTGGIITWFEYSDRKGISIKVGDRTQLLLPFIGLYEIALSGNVYVGAINQLINMYVNGVLYLNNACYYNTAVGWTSVSLNVIVPAYSVNTFVQFALSANMQTATNVQLFLKAKFLSLM